MRESIGRYNACANVNASPKPRAVISQRRPCPNDSNETQSFSADVDYDKLVTSMIESSSLSSLSSLLPRESIKEQSRVDVSNYGFDGSLPKGCGEDVAFNEDDLLGNNLQAINNAEAAFQEEHRFKIFDLDAPVERASMASDSLFGPRVAAPTAANISIKIHKDAASMGEETFVTLWLPMSELLGRLGEDGHGVAGPDIFSAPTQSPIGPKNFLGIGISSWPSSSSTTLLAESEGRKSGGGEGIVGATDDAPTGPNMPGSASSAPKDVRPLSWIIDQDESSIEDFEAAVKTKLSSTVTVNEFNINIDSNNNNNKSINNANDKASSAVNKDGEVLLTPLSGMRLTYERRLEEER